jgi:two-component system NtrC family sensor kinase
LGLSITHRIVSQHHGEITASSPGEGKGATFRVRLPIHPSEIADGDEDGANGLAGNRAALRAGAQEFQAV